MEIFSEEYKKMIKREANDLTATKPEDLASSDSLLQVPWASLRIFAGRG